MDVNEVIKDAHNFARMNPEFILSIKDESLVTFIQRITETNAALGDTLESLRTLDNTKSEEVRQELITISNQVFTENKENSL